MITPEQLTIINNRLADKYGKIDNLPYFRLSWSEDLLEKRWTEFTDEGWQLHHPEVREVPKYKQWIKEKYILEGLTVVPTGMSDLTTPLSYEPVWTFEDKHGNALEPKWDAIYFILESLKDAQSGSQRVKYKEPEDTFEVMKERIEKIEAELFGNETSVSDALAYHGGIIVPSNYIKEK